MPELLFELVGPNYELAKAEVMGGLEGLSLAHEVERFEDGILAVDVRGSSYPEILFSRLGLSRRIHHLVGITSLKEYDFSSLLKEYDPPQGSTAVRTKKIEGHQADTKKIKEELGRVISQTNPIDLEEPDHELFALISKNLFIGKKIYEVDRREMRAREVKNRPFSSPISLKPWLTRALINIARPSENSRIHDPFCGTGGILIEGSKMGLNVSGGDKDPSMIEGCRRNLDEFNVKADLKVGDVSQTIPDKIDAVVSDPPYGRAASTSKEDLESIYQRLFETCEKRLKEGGYLAAIFPGEEYVDLGQKYLQLLESYKLRVHRSLDRYFTVFKKSSS